MGFYMSIRESCGVATERRSMETIISSVISGLVALAVCLLNSNSQRRTADAKHNETIAIINVKIDNLASKVEKLTDIRSRLSQYQYGPFSYSGNSCLRTVCRCIRSYHHAYHGIIKAEKVEKDGNGNIISETYALATDFNTLENELSAAVSSAQAAAQSAKTDAASAKTTASKSNVLV